MKRILIAEAGNNHFGSLTRAKEMIKTAKSCGADLVKFQAIPQVGMTGSMPADFYSECALSINEYLELIDFGNLNMIPVFFSIFFNDNEIISKKQHFHKLSASQTAAHIGSNTLKMYDYPNTFISFKKGHIFQSHVLAQAIPLYATEYGSLDPELFYLDYLKKITNPLRFNSFGYSDHNPGIIASLYAVHSGASVVEKHFTLEKEMKWKGHVFRDTVHGANPNELEKLALAMSV